MSILLKDPAATLDYAVDWAADYLNTDAIVASTWVVQPDSPDELIVLGDDFTAGTARVTLAGGKAGGVYRVTNHVSMASGTADSRSIIIRVEKR